MKSTVRLGHMSNLPASMTLFQVEGTEMKAALWRYFAKWGKDIYVYALLMTYSGVYMVVLGWVRMDLPELRSMVQRLLIGLRTPMRVSLFSVFRRI